jgi:hypothetical protein
MKNGSYFIPREQIYTFMNPGAWFKYAFVDRTQPNWNAPTASNMWGINPNREIDPIFGTRVSIQLDF